VMHILLNLKKLRVKLFSNGPETVYLSAKKEGPVTAGMVQENSNVEVINKDLVIATLEPGGKLDMEIEISRGRGYVPAEDIQAQASWPAGFLPVDALFSPVVKAHYDVENARVGQVTDYDRLILEIWTDGSVTAMDALIRSAKLLRELGGTSMIGPVLVGMEKSVQIATMASNASELLTLAVLAAGGIAL